MKTILSALAVVMLLGATPASAACWAGPSGVHCWHPAWHHWHDGGWGWHHGW